MVLLVTLALLVPSALVGSALYLLFRRSRRVWLKWTVSIAVGVIAALCGAVAYLVLSDTPATNERIGEPRRLSIRLSDRRSVSSDVTTGRSVSSPVAPPPPAAESLGEISILAPESVVPREDFSIGITVTSKREFPTGDHPVRLSAPSSAEVRTLDTCPTIPSMACARSDGHQFRVAWDITPIQGGQLLFTIGLPTDLVPQAGLTQWYGRVVGSPSTDGAYGGSTLRGPPNDVSSTSPFATWDGVAVDLRNQQFRVPVTVVTTLGVSRNVYNSLAVIGTVLSALLGSGWLWQILGLWRGRKGKSVVSDLGQANAEANDCDHSIRPNSSTVGRR